MVEGSAKIKIGKVCENGHLVEDGDGYHHENDMSRLEKNAPPSGPWPLNSFKPKDTKWKEQGSSRGENRASTSTRLMVSFAPHHRHAPHYYPKNPQTPTLSLVGTRGAIQRSPHPQCCFVSRQVTTTETQQNRSKSHDHPHNPCSYAGSTLRANMPQSSDRFRHHVWSNTP